MTATNPLPLDSESLLSGDWIQCQQLFVHSYPYSGNDNQPTINPDSLIATLKQLQANPDLSLLEAAQLHADHSESLNRQSYAMIRFVDQLYDNYFDSNQLHPVINQQLKQLRPAAVISLLNKKLPWSDNLNPAKVLPLIVRHTIGWQPELGRAAQRYLDSLKGPIEQLAEADTAEQLSTAVKRLSDFYNAEQQRIKKLEQRLVDSEIGALQAKHAQQHSARSLNQLMAGKKLPASITSLLQHRWREFLQLTIINHGINSEPWHRLFSLTERLIASFQPVADDPHQSRDKAIIELTTELAEELKPFAHHSDPLNQELAVIEQEHMHILKGLVPQYAGFELIDNSNPLLSSQLSISRQLLNKVTTLEPGQWFFYRLEGHTKRIKLVLKIDREQQLLFTSFIGVKSEQFSFEEFAYLLSSQIVIPVGRNIPLSGSGARTIDNLLQHYNQQRQRLANQRAIEQEQKNQQKMAREQARKKALKEASDFVTAQQQARLKAEEEKTRRDRQIQQQQHLQQVKDQLDRFQLGGRITFYNDHADNNLNCRLAAILQTTGEYIFVDSAGIKQKVMTKHQLAECLEQHSAIIVDCGSDFENTLEKVVNNLRTRKRP